MAKQRGIFEHPKRKGIWCIHYFDAEGERHREVIGRKSDAVTMLAMRRLEKLERKLPTNLKGSTVPFRVIVADALTHSRAENGVRSTAELDLRFKAILPSFGDRDAHTIRQQEIVEWLVASAERRKWSDATRNRYQAAFSLVFRVAIDNGKLQQNPAARIKRRAEASRIRFLSPTEETLLREVMARRCAIYLPALDISLNTGMRASEQFSLEWGQVDLEQRRLTLTKTKSKRVRHLPLSSSALKAFTMLKEGSSRNHVFINKRGSKLRSHRDWFDGVVREAGLKGYTWHANRHTFASRLVMAGVDLRTVADFLGHATIQQTMVYAHLAPDHKLEAISRLERYGKGQPSEQPLPSKRRETVDINAAE